MILKHLEKVNLVIRHMSCTVQHVQTFDHYMVSCVHVHGNTYMRVYTVLPQRVEEGAIKYIHSKYILYHIPSYLLLFYSVLSLASCLSLC